VTTPTTSTQALTRDEIISRNIAAVDQHFHTENPEGIDLAVGVYTDDCRENGYEIWRRADDERLVRDDIPADAVVQEFA
jgi:hypothetical protein